MWMNEEKLVCCWYTNTTVCKETWIHRLNRWHAILNLDFRVEKFPKYTLINNQLVLYKCNIYQQDKLQIVSKG